MARKTPYSKSRLNEFLAVVGNEAETIDDDGTPITKEEAVARLIYKKALGWTEKRVIEDEYGNTSEVEEYHPPENWAIQYVFERREGKAPIAPPMAEDKSRMTAAERVRELATSRLNDIADASGRTRTGPPKYDPNA